MRGGEQPETDSRSQTKVNSIQRTIRASVLGNGEACSESGEPVTVLGLPILETGRVSAWVEWERLEGLMNKWRDRRWRLTGAGVRGSIVALKPGNAGGAKGPRKVKAR